MLTIGKCNGQEKKYSNESCPSFIRSNTYTKTYIICGNCKFWTQPKKLVAYTW